MRQAFYILILIAMLVALIGNQASGSRSIRIRSAVNVESDAVLLSDVADINVDDEMLRNQLLSLSVAQIGRGDSTVLVGSFEIASSLASIGIVPASFSIHGASRCEVSHLTEAVTAGEVQAVEIAEVSTDDTTLAMDAAMTELEQRLDAEVSRIMGLPRTSLRGEWRYQNTGLLEKLTAGGRVVSVNPQRAVSLGRVQFAVTLADNVGQNQQFMISGRVWYLCRSVVAMRSLNVGEVIGQNDVRLEVREVMNLNDVGVSDLSQVINQEVARGIRANQVVSLSSIRKIQLISRRDIVEVIHRVGSINLRFRGVALSGGGLGDFVQVHNQSNDTIVEGRITGPGEITVGASEFEQQMRNSNTVAYNSNPEQIYYLER